MYTVLFLAHCISRAIGSDNLNAPASPFSSTNNRRIEHRQSRAEIYHLRAQLLKALEDNRTCQSKWQLNAISFETHLLKITTKFSGVHCGYTLYVISKHVSDAGHLRRMLQMSIAWYHARCHVFGIDCRLRA